MAATNHQPAATNFAHGLFSEPAPPVSDGSDEFTEFDVWGSFPAGPISPQQAELLRAGRPTPSARGDRAGDRRRAAAASMPVNIPDWSKILGNRTGSYRKKASGVYFTAECDVGEEEVEIAISGERRMVPPHELLGRNRAASMSVHEGVGRTLKGRDLSRVRDAVWEITGFQD
ncbi:uncharacterized protein LOC121972989 [Zingiber officinale]|uniref:Uncharacterized protein n=1 Tax=Zingiber officinale TaxID=94328 RepID=A0A8J5HHE4_ZINOF|nr:uncharacterized protein LOC121972989 [Zingiber officinale]KAG6516560.1 hypothetical protein ZIOFF_027025 [Zingiber officinale]